MSPPDTICPVCRRGSIQYTRIPSAVPRSVGIIRNRTHAQDAVFYDCPCCGRFAVARDDRNDFLDIEAQRTKLCPVRLSALLREQTIAGLPPYWVQFRKEAYGPLEHDDLASVHVGELLQKWPRTIPERLDRTLRNFARLSPTGGHLVEYNHKDCSLAFAETPHELLWNIQCLVDRRYLDQLQGATESSRVALTAEGWERFEALSHGKSARENPVFVAMWFGAKVKGADDEITQAEMKDLYLRGIEPAVRGACYDVTRVDLAEHNEWIMDKVLGDIRHSPFVVADFTGNRNGVYFEAGFARGLGIPVIHTCKEDDFNKAHFDTKQLNHILWKTPEELRERLQNRIMATQGRGPHPPPAAPK